VPKLVASDGAELAEERQSTDILHCTQLTCCTVLTTNGSVCCPRLILLCQFLRLGKILLFDPPSCIGVSPFERKYFLRFRAIKNYVNYIRRSAMSIHIGESMVGLIKEFVIIRIPGNRRVFVKTGPVFNYCMMCGNCLQNRAICPTLLPPRRRRFHHM
jgi:hypothetical protein